MNAILPLAAIALATTAALGQAVMPPIDVPLPNKPAYEVAFALRLTAFQNATQLFAILDADRPFTGILLASPVPTMMGIPQLLPVLANPVVLGWCMGEEAWTFDFPRVPWGMQLHLQGVGITLDQQLAATHVEHFGV